MREQNVLNLFHQATADWFLDAFGAPTKVQEAAWPAIASGAHTLVCAPTGTGKTLSAFLVFLDKLKALESGGALKEELMVIYVSPLKSLAGDIRENLNRPLLGISAGAVRAAIRTGDTPQKERQRMGKHPPHILITTPESLYLMLTSKSGKQVLHTAKAVIIDELHALIDTKRGAHFMLSIARLDKLCGRPLQRIGLSATIEPLDVAAAYLSPDPVVIAAPAVTKKIRLSIVSPFSDEDPMTGRDPIWQRLAAMVFEACQGKRSVIAFTEGRRYAEKLAYYVNMIGGEGFARTHHGSLSKEQRFLVEQELRDGRLRLLCATSSMELGIDVGEIDQVLQIGCPRTISGAMQRLGRAGHNPGRVSAMTLFPRTVPESVQCGLTAETVRRGGVEEAHPPRLCLDCLAQHLVSMAAQEPYSVSDVMEILSRAYPFRGVTREDVKAVLAMLAGDYEHSRDIPARPRLLYDRIHETVEGDAYSRMLAVSAGGTIPDKGLYTAKTEEGVVLGELDEEFVFESYVGDRFMLGTFAWEIVSQDKDSVIVRQAGSALGARLPFWKGETGGRSFGTCLTFGTLLRGLGDACENETVTEELLRLGLDSAAAADAAGYLRRQMEAVGGLPDDRTVIVEHFRDHMGSSQLVVHSIFGRRVNAPLSLLMRLQAEKATHGTIGCMDEEDGFLIFPYDGEPLPHGLLQSIGPEAAESILKALLPVTPLFHMTFRYNAARALMMGVKKSGRQPLWVQRLRSAQMMEDLITRKDHPLIRETTRECIEDVWDMKGVAYVLNGIRSGMIAVREIDSETPSPMAMAFQWQTESTFMYDYSPTPKGVSLSVDADLKQAQMIAPSPEALLDAAGRRKLPEDEKQLHSLLMTEGDFLAGELDVPVDWFERLVTKGRAAYVEPGLWIAEEQRAEYEAALGEKQQESRLLILRRMLRYRGPKSAEEVSGRYFLPVEAVQELLEELCRREEAVEDRGVYYHAKLYDQARRQTVRARRQEIATRPGHCYAALMAGRAAPAAPAEEQLRMTLRKLCEKPFPLSLWETVILPERVKDYRESLLDALLARGEFFWRMEPGGKLSFYSYDSIDWDAAPSGLAGLAVRENVGEGPIALKLTEEEEAVYAALERRGASFINGLTGLLEDQSPYDILLTLAAKGLVCADSFVPVRQWLNREKAQRASVRQRVGMRMKGISAGRWDVARPVKGRSMEQRIEDSFDRMAILCRETAKEEELPWAAVLEKLRVWEYTGRVRRGYFVEGMSGAQFIRSQDFSGVIQALGKKESGIQWLNAADPDQVWGKALPHMEGKSFVNVPGSVVALRGGIPTAIFERQGKTLRCFDASELTDVLSVFAAEFKKRRLYPALKRLIVKEYPQGAKEALLNAGFLREMQDYVLYR